MANPLYNMFGRNMPTNPMADLVKQAKEFKKQFTNINPRTEVERLLNSGQMSQQQFNQYSQIAQQVARFMDNK